MEFVYFTVVAIGLYFFADWLLDQVERRLGRRLQQRSLVFFAILLVSAVISFEVIRRLVGT